MKQQVIHASRVVSGGLVVAALAFGVSQAMAAPKPDLASARICDPGRCEEECVANGALWGTCTSRMICECYYP